MRFRILLSIAAASLMLASCGSTTPQPANAPAASPAATVGSISISDPWARATVMSATANMAETAEAGMAETPQAGVSDHHGAMDGTKTGASYMTIANSGTEADRLVAARADVAETAELHTVVDENGVMRMRPIEGGIEVPANGSVTLRPGSYHIMMIGLTNELKAGDSVNLTLQFEKAGEVTVVARVRES